jgi:hypothetical protein
MIDDKFMFKRTLLKLPSTAIPSLKTDNCTTCLVALCGLMVIALAIVTKFCGIKPGQGRWIFKGYKNFVHDFLRRGSKAVGPM